MTTERGRRRPRVPARFYLLARRDTRTRTSALLLGRALPPLSPCLFCACISVSVKLNRLMSRLCSCLVLLCACAAATATTTITNNRTEVAWMASLWEADSIQISPLANAQYPQFTTNWQFIFPHANISSDGDVHIDMAI